MFYILLCFYLWIYGTLNKMSYHKLHDIMTQKTVILTVSTTRIPNSLFQKMQISRQIDMMPILRLHYPIKVFWFKTSTLFSYIILQQTTFGH